MTLLPIELSENFLATFCLKKSRSGQAEREFLYMLCAKGIKSGCFAEGTAIILKKIKTSKSFISRRKGFCILKHKLLTLRSANAEKKLLHCGKFTFP
ncbi:MAG TPA: hypothetical protein PK228_19100 [Saprospiraceae bacterium]|nr:hypothetical protein [Saprospiraceae bacterium]